LFHHLKSHQRDLGVVKFASNYFTRNNPTLLISIIIILLSNVPKSNFVKGTTCIALFLQLRRHQRDLGVVAFALKRFTRNDSELLIFVNFFSPKTRQMFEFFSLF